MALTTGNNDIFLFFTFTVEVSKLSASLDSMGEVAVAPVSPTTKSACRPHVTAISWNSVKDHHTILTSAQTMSSPSPPLTTQSVSVPSNILVLSLFIVLTT